MVPVVSVPVLSNTMVSTARVASSTCAPLMMMPSRAARPVPTNNATGVARPKAHGHAITNTATAASNDRCTSPLMTSQPTRVATESTITAGTNTELTLSASRCTGALPSWARSTSRAICASTVSRPIRVARTSSRPFALSVPPVTTSPGRQSTGTLSPVIMLASMLLSPSTTTPSVATVSPGRTTNVSPTPSAPMGMTVSFPSRHNVTDLAPRSNNARNASPARRRARTSNQRPAKINATNVVATSR